MFKKVIKSNTFFIFFLIMIVYSSNSNILSKNNTKKKVLSKSNLQLIPCGWFEMGSENGNSDESPVHKVFIDSFYISKSEVTIWEYLECVKSGVVEMPDWWNKTYFDESNYKDSKPNWLDLPVTGVSWIDAVKFCNWKGESYRLPTEAEWEYAARAGIRTEYLWGNKSAGGDFFENFDKRALELANIGGGLKHVKSLKANNFGLYDMIGNVWEWCTDYYEDDYYSKSEIKNPIGPIDPKNPNIRSVRGGSWNEYSFNLRLANRSYGEFNKGYKGVGFRIVYKKKSKLNETEINYEEF